MSDYCSVDEDECWFSDELSESGYSQGKQAAIDRGSGEVLRSRIRASVGGYAVRL